ncbi:MAG: polysaccharide biosynthesis tyrosine autokinase [Kiloniellales bacterium]
MTLAGGATRSRNLNLQVRQPYAEETRGPSPHMMARTDVRSGNLRRSAKFLSRHRFLIIGSALAGVLIAAVIAWQLPQRYSAEAELLVAGSAASGESQTLAALLQGRALAGRVVERLELAQYDDFAALLAPERPGFLDRASHWLVGFLSAIGAIDARPPIQTTALSLDPDTAKARLVDAHLARLSVESAPDSRLLRLSYRAGDPALAATALNTTMALYLEQADGTAANRADPELAAAEQALETAEAQRAALRAAEGGNPATAVTTASLALAQVRGELAAARAALAESETRAEQAITLLKTPGGLEQAAVALESPLLQSLRIEEMALSRKIAQLAEGAPNGGALTLARGELTDLQDRIRGEVEKQSAVLDDRRIAASSRVVSLEKEASRLADELQGAETRRLALNAADEAVSRARARHAQLLQAAAPAFGARPDAPAAEVISRARPPETPAWPPRLWLVAGGLLVSLLLAILVARIVESMDRGYRSLGEVEADTGLPGLGLVPLAEDGYEHLPHLSLLAQRGSPYAEAIRTLRTAITLSSNERAPRSVVVASSNPNEGKTSTVVSMAVQSAQSGKRAIVVDCDLRQSRIGMLFGRGQGPGLTDYLAGLAGLEDIISVDRRSGVHFIGGGSRPGPRVELLGGERMRLLLKALSETYPLVLLDTPPLLAVSDACVLLRQADATLFLIRWEKTPREVARNGLKLALSAGANLVGVALSQVDAKRHARYDYADSGLYHDPSYRKYYFI